jgi:hypothetical protein
MALDKTGLRIVLRAALPTAFDADTEEPGAARLFSPTNHGLALDPDVTLVRGGRGVGKTWWFLSLQNTALRQLAAKEYRIARLAGTIRVHPGYGTMLDTDHYPGPSAIAELLPKHGPDAIWHAICLHALGYGGFVGDGSWHARVARVSERPAIFEEHLGAVDATADDEHLLLFDALDRLSASAEATDNLVTALLKVALELRTRTRRIRAKVFARPDLVEHRLNFADASKITANAVDLRWTNANLYGLLFTRMANAAGDHASNFRDWTNDKWFELEPGTWRADRLGGNPEKQAEVFTRIAGPYMGTNHRRGRTYPWLPDHLADGRKEASPRSFLSALAAAVEHTESERAGHSFALHFDSIKSGVQRASEIRVDEISEDVPWVPEAISALQQMSVPVDSNDVLARWKESPTLLKTMTQASTDERDVRVGPRDPGNWNELVQNLIQLGVMTVRADGRLDVPDVYRVAFGIARKGGVPRLANR